MGKQLGTDVLRWVRADLHAQFEDTVERGEWSRVLGFSAEGACLSLCMDLYLCGVVPDERWPEVLAEALDREDAPARESSMLEACLMRLLTEGRRVFDGDAARAAFAELPQEVTIYRGTTEAEGSKHGICWTLDRERAAELAAQHSRSSVRSHTPVILQAELDRGDICGLLFEGNRKDVLIVPRYLRNIRHI